MASVLTLADLDFSYDTSPDPLFSKLNLSFPRGWTGVVGPNGSGKTTLSRLVCGRLDPLSGRVSGPSPATYCPQRTDFPPERLHEFLTVDCDGEAAYWRSRLKIGEDWFARWDTLSHGERKRAQLAVALWRGPAVLAVDEPTNHLDRVAREPIAEALASYSGIGLLVSHDRDLLDRLCIRCLFIEPLRVRMFPGTYTEAVEQRDRENLHLRRERRRAEQNVAKVERQAAKRRHVAAQSKHRNSGHGLDRKDHDAREKLGRVRISGKDGQAGRLQSQLDGRMRQTKAALERTTLRKEYELGIWFEGERSRRTFIASVEEGRIDLGGDRELAFSPLRIGPEDRIGLTGPNGAGKSTLLKHLLAHAVLEPDKLVYLPQEMDAVLSHDILANARKLGGDDLGRLMTVVSRLGSRPRRLLESPEPSPGELRKLLLAQGIVRGPHLIVMDEPTNHLDLTAITCLEEALKGCPCALLLVSHDERFLCRLTTLRWDIRDGYVEME